MFPNQNKNHQLPNTSHTLLWMVGIANALLIGTIWLSGSINYNLKSSADTSLPTLSIHQEATMPKPQEGHLSTVPYYSAADYPVYPQPQAAYYPSQTSSYYYGQPVRFLVGF